jgi:hypothetical protein
VCSINLCLVTGLLYLAFAPSFSLQSVCLLLLLGGELIGAGLSDAGISFDRGSVWPAEVCDVSGGIVDLLNLERVDDQAQFLHLGSRRGAR